MRAAGADHADDGDLTLARASVTSHANVAGASHLLWLPLRAIATLRKEIARIGARPYGGAMDAPPSPCTGVCVIDPASALCRGCARTLAEITAWYRAGATEKQAILVRCEKRLASGGKAP